MNKRNCINCNSHLTYIRKGGYEMWYKYDGGYLCQKCKNRLICNPKYNKKWNPRHMLFVDKQILLKKRALTGNCKRCGKSIGDEYIDKFGNIAIIKRTSMHHIKYHDDDPLKDTMELCNSCHGKENLGKKYKRLNNLNNITI